MGIGKNSLVSAAVESLSREFWTVARRLGRARWHIIPIRGSMVGIVLFGQIGKQRTVRPQSCALRRETVAAGVGGGFGPV